MFALTLGFLGCFTCALPGANTRVEERLPFVESISFQVNPATLAGGQVGPNAEMSFLGGDRGYRIHLAPRGSDAAGEGRFTSPVLVPRHPFRDLLTSWNVVTPPETGFAVEVRVGSGSDAPWSPWMFVGDWGRVPAIERTTTCDGGRVDTDYFRAERPFERAQFRLRAFGPADDSRRVLVVERFTLCFSDRERLVDPQESRSCSMPGPFDPERGRSARADRRLEVPFRSQKVESAAIAGRICSPTSLAMVLAYRGVDVPTADVAARAYDALNDIYGNWPENIQAAFSYGVPGYLTRIAGWSVAESLIAAGQPLVVSIAARRGELSGAPYAQTAGHLLVLTGFDANGDCCVNDPAAPDAKGGRRVYARAEMQTVWLDRGGTAYVLLEKP